MPRPSRNTILLGAALLAQVDEIAERQRRTRLQQIAFLVDLALAAPVAPPPQPDSMAEEPPKSGRTAVPADITRKVLKRTGQTGESLSAAVRALVLAGIAIQGNPQ